MLGRQSRQSSPSTESPTLMKRRKTDSPSNETNNNTSVGSVSIDAFNTATIQDDASLKSDDDDVIAATPKSADQKKENRRKKAIKSNVPNVCKVKDEAISIEVKSNAATVVKSPLKCVNVTPSSSPNRMIKSKSMHRAGAESTPKAASKWESKSKFLAKTPTNLFQNWPSSNVSFMQPAAPPLIVKVKSPMHRLRLSSKKHLKQATLDFAGKLERKDNDVKDEANVECRIMY